MYPLSNWMAALLNCRQNFSLQMWGNDDNRARRNLSSDTISVKVPQMGRINALRISNFQNKDLRICGTTKGHPPFRDKFCTHLWWSCFPKWVFNLWLIFCHFFGLGPATGIARGLRNISDYCAQQHQPAPGMESAQLWSRKKRREFEQNPTLGKFNLKKIHFLGGENQLY